MLAGVPTTSTADEIEKALLRSGIVMMASSPPQNNTIKFYFYAQEVCSMISVPERWLIIVLQAASMAFHLLEATLELDSRMLSANIKSTAQDSSPIFAMVVRQTLANGNLIDMM